MLTTEKKDLTKYSKDIKVAVEFLNQEHGLGIAMPYDAPSEYAALKACRKHWVKLRKGGIDLIKEKEYPQIRQIESLGDRHWRCTNHSKGTLYEITKDGEQFHCSCPANTHGTFCSHIEALLNSDVYINGPVSAQWVGVVSLDDALSRLSAGKTSCDRTPLFFESDPLKNGSTPEDLVGLGEFDAPWDDLSLSIGDKADSELLPYPGGLRPSEKGSRSISKGIDSSRSSIPSNQFLASDNSPVVLPNGFEATKDQGNALCDVFSWYAGSEQFYVVSGRAGTGKTTLQQLIVEQLPATRIAIVAPSNKAVKVVQSKVAQVRGKVVDTMTVAKLLGIRPSRHSDVQKFEKDPKAESLVSQYQLIIVDECSMVGADSFEWLTREMNGLFSQSTKCLLMGDDAQLPPVLEDISLTFTDVKQQSRLSEVVRHDGAILEWCTFLTDHLKDHRIIKPQTSFNEDKSKGIWVLPKKGWESQLIRAFTAARDKAYGPDQVRALAWTNKRVNQLNAKVRGALNPRAAQFEEDDRLIVKTPFALSMFGDEPDDWLQTSDELTVVRAGVSGTVEGIPVWNVLVRTGSGMIVQIPVVKMSGVGIYKQRLKEFRDAKLFDAYWTFKESFCDVTHAYALTTHNSQGSTFKDVFIDAKDICKCADRTGQGTWLRQHLLYVAAGRASHRVFVTFE